MPTTPPIKVPIVGEDRTATALRSATGNINRLGATARSALGMFGVGIGVTAFTRLANEAIQYGSSITDAATATRMGIEEYQVLSAVAQDAGAGMDKVTTASAKMQKAANDAQNGLTTYVRAFDALGVNIAKFKQLSPERQFEVLGRAMVNSEDQATAYASVLDIIGSRNAPRLMEMLQRLGVDGFDNLSAAMIRSGRVMDEETAKRMDKAADTLLVFKTRATIVAADVSEALMDTVAAEGRFFSNIASGMNPVTAVYEAFASQTEKINERYEKMADGAATAADANQDLAAAVGDLNQQMEQQTALQKLVDADMQAQSKSFLAARLEYEKLQSAYESKTTSPADNAEDLRDRARAAVERMDQLEKYSEGWYLVGQELYKIQTELNGIDQSTASAREEQEALLREQQLIINPLQESALLQREITELKAELLQLDGLEAEEKRIELLEKQNRLLQIQKSNQEDAEAARQRSINALLGTAASTGGINADPTDQRSTSHLMGDYSATAFASPWAAAGTIADPQAATTLATDSAAQSISSGADSASALLTEVADYMQQLVTGLETLKSQVANAL
jgi:myosin heavy subunit